jgi:outer membrane receptor protein involved in Fe transport
VRGAHGRHLPRLQQHRAGSAGLPRSTLSDRYYRGPTGRGYITGNPDLDPETSIQFDWTLRYTAQRYRVAAFYYQYRINDLIERYQTTIDEFYFRNRGGARIRGFEVEAQANLGGGFSVDVASQVAEGVALDTGSYLDDISPFNFDSAAQVVRRTGSRRRASRSSRTTTTWPDQRPVPGYTLLDAAAGYTVVAPLEIACRRATS